MFPLSRTLLPASARFHHVAVVVAVSLGAACTASAEADGDPGETESDDSALSASSIQELGPIARGETKPVDYTPTPKYRAFTFAAKQGDNVDFWVRSTNGDAVAYILRPNHNTLAQNDDADATTRDAHVTASIPRDGTYYLAVKEYKGRNAQFNVTFTGPTPRPSRTVGVTWHGEEAREEIHTVDLATLNHTFVAALPGIAMTGENFSNPVTGTVYVQGSGADGVQRLFGIHGTTGAIVSNPPMPSFTYDSETSSYRGYNFAGGFHVMASGKVVGVTWHGEAAREEIHEVNLATLTHTLIAPIPEIVGTSEHFEDPTRGIVYIVASDASGVRCLYAIDATTGAVLSKPRMPPFTYDAEAGTYHGFNFAGGFHIMADGRAVGLTWNGDAAREELRAVNLATLTHTLIAPVPDILLTGDHFDDPVKGIVYVRASGGDGIERLFAIDATTGATLSKPATPAFVYDSEANSYRGYNFSAGFHILP